MCILFYHAKKLATPGKFRLVVVSNRDESLCRPTEKAHFWEECLDILGGMYAYFCSYFCSQISVLKLIMYVGRDLQPGADKGTWLAMNRRTGRLATLLNLANKASNPNALSRGHIVADFVKDSACSGVEYGTKIAAKADLHNPFHLITFEIL